MQDKNEYRNCGLREMADRLGISPAYLCDVEKGRRGIKPGLLKAMIKAGYDKEWLSRFEPVMYRRKAPRLKTFAKKNLP